MSEPLTSRVAQFEADVGLTHDLVHGPDTAEVQTESGPLRTFARLQRDLELDLNAAAAITETGQNRAAASASAADAQTAQAAAEAARDAALLSVGVFATVATGLSGTTNGQYFSVPSPESREHLILYRNDSGAAEEVKRYPSAAALIEAQSVSDAARVALLDVAANMISTQAIVAGYHAFA